MLQGVHTYSEYLHKFWLAVKGNEACRVCCFALPRRSGSLILPPWRCSLIFLSTRPMDTLRLCQDGTAAHRCWLSALKRWVAVPITSNRPAHLMYPRLIPLPCVSNAKTWLPDQFRCTPRMATIFPRPRCSALLCQQTCFGTPPNRFLPQGTLPFALSRLSPCPDWSTFSWASGEVLLWNEATQQASECKRVHESSVTVVRWAIDGTRLLTGDDVSRLMLGNAVILQLSATSALR